MKRFLFFIGAYSFLYGLSLGQGDIDKQDKLFYRNEKSGSFFLSSTGWGLNGRIAKHINAANKKMYDLDFAIIKHPQELKQSGISSIGNLVYGKKNIAFDFRFGFGNQKEIFRKLDIGGVSIRRYYSYGPSLVFLKPVYYEVYDTTDHTMKTQKFSDNIYWNPSNRASFFRGFGELKPIPGAFLKVGMSFEYSPDDQILHAIEVGAVIEGFTARLDLMDSNNNYQFFLSLFVSYRFGKVFDPNAPKAKKKKDYFY
jgi:hypothetical protein